MIGNILGVIFSDLTSQQFIDLRFGMFDPRLNEKGERQIPRTLHFEARIY